MADPGVRSVPANGLDIEVATAGSGPALLLLHGFPHTWRVWTQVMPALAETRTVLAADLRGLGGTSRAEDGYDTLSLSEDVGALLDGLGVGRADLAAIDAGVPAAFAFALQHPDRVGRLILMESTLGTLPGAEDFFAGGPPWWFGFHQVPGLAEDVLLGHEGAYLDFFFRTGTHDGSGIDPPIRDAFVAAYTGRESLRCAFAHYRAMAQSAGQLADLVSRLRLTVPTLALGARPVGVTLHAQLQPIADELCGHVLDDCGHIMPLDRPDVLAQLMTDFLAGAGF